MMKMVDTSRIIVLALIMIGAMNQQLIIPTVAQVQDNYSTKFLRTDNRKLNEETNDPKPSPMVYTFFEPIDNPFVKDKQEYNENQKLMLQIWTETWKTMGFTPHILTLDDAKQHPEFDSVNEKLNHIPLDGKHGETDRFGEYNRLCYLRWLAIGADHVGGGFFADYDTIPVVPPKMDDWEESLGQFHLYDHGSVPALLSGSKDEYTRLLHLMIDTGRGHENDELYSDMHALMQVVKGQKCDCKLENKVLRGQFILTGREIEPEDCREIQKFRAIHFSHYALQVGVLKEGYGIQDRGKIIQEWFQMYLDKCGSQL